MRTLKPTVVRESTAVLELLAGEDETLLVRRDTLLVLDLRLDVVDGVRGLDLEGDGLAREAGWVSMLPGVSSSFILLSAHHRSLRTHPPFFCSPTADGS
jgi:hypothetical protein